MPLIRRLDPAFDRAAVADLFDRAADYVWLETGAAPTRETLAGFFDDAPPGVPPEDCFQAGLWQDDQLAGILGYAFGFPEARDCYIGLMLFDPARRGNGLGPRLLAHVQNHARHLGASRLLIAVLDTNPKGRAFWEREGFRLEKSFPPVRIGGKSHIRHRMARPL